MYVNDLPLAEGKNESTLLFADDILYNIRYKYKEKNRCIIDAKEKAQKKIVKMKAKKNNMEKRK